MSKSETPARRNAPTIRDVAGAAEVSIATVSNVLHDKKTLYTQETADRVWCAVREVGYRPNLVAQSLVRQRTDTLGVIVEHPHGRLTRNTYMSLLLDGYLEFAVKAGYQIKIITLLDSGCEVNQRLLEDGSVDGLALFAPLRESPLLKWAQTTRMPLVIAGSAPDDCSLPCVEFDDESAAYDLVMWLVQQGHRDIGLITGLLSQWSAIRRERGYRRAMSEAGIVPPPHWRYEGNYSSLSGEEGAQWLSENAPELTAIVCGNDKAAMGAINRIQQLGKSVPESISIVGFDDIEGAQWIHPKLTTMRQPVMEIGMKTAEILIRQIETGIRELTVHSFSGELIIRQSVRCGER